MALQLAAPPPPVRRRRWLGGPRPAVRWRRTTVAQGCGATVAQGCRATAAGAFLLESRASTHSLLLPSFLSFSGNKQRGGAAGERRAARGGKSKLALSMEKKQRGGSRTKSSGGADKKQRERPSSASSWTATPVAQEKQGWEEAGASLPRASYPEEWGRGRWRAPLSSEAMVAGVPVQTTSQPLCQSSCQPSGELCAVMSYSWKKRRTRVSTLRASYFS